VALGSLLLSYRMCVIESETSKAARGEGPQEGPQDRNLQHLTTVITTPRDIRNRRQWPPASRLPHCGMLLAPPTSLSCNLQHLLSHCYTLIGTSVHVYHPGSTMSHRSYYQGRDVSGLYHSNRVPTPLVHQTSRFDSPHVSFRRRGTDIYFPYLVPLHPFSHTHPGRPWQG